MDSYSNSPPTGEAPEALLRGQVSAAPLAAGLPVLVRHEAAGGQAQGEVAHSRVGRPQMGDLWQVRWTPLHERTNRLVLLSVVKRYYHWSADPKSTETQRKYLALLDGGKYFYPQCMINPIDSPYPVIIATTIFAARGCNIFLNIMNPDLLS